MPKLRTVSIDELDKLQVDEENHIYWDGAQIVTSLRLTLPWWANVAVVVAALAAVGTLSLNVLQSVGVLKQAVPQITVTVNYGEPPTIKTAP